jgi:hypothetical protein
MMAAIAMSLISLMVGLCAGYLLAAVPNAKNLRIHGPRVMDSGELNQACATIGTIMISYPRGYSFFPVTYEGVNYWGEGAKKHLENGCADRALQTSFSTEWPGLSVVEGSSYFTSGDPRFIAITLEGNKSPDPEESIERVWKHWMALDGEPLGDVRSRIDRQAGGIADQELGLMRARIKRAEKPGIFPSMRTVYWDRPSRNSLTTLIKCDTYIQGVGTCEQRMYVEDWDVWLVIHYRHGLLYRWKEMRDQGIPFIAQFIKQQNLPEGLKASALPR